MPRLTDLAQLGTTTLTSPGGASVPPPVAGEEYYNLNRTAISVTEENDTFDISLTTANVSGGTSVAYTITGVSSADINGANLTGSFSVPNSTFQVVSYQSTSPVTIRVDVSSNIPSGTYTSAGTVTSGGQTLAVQSVQYFGAGVQELELQLPSNFSVLPTPGDFVEIQGLIYSSGFWPQVTSSAITFTTTPDATEEGTESFLLSLDNGEDSVSVSIQDTSKPTYNLTGPTVVNEGDTINITLTTTNVADSTVLPYTISGVDSADINGASLTGNFTVTSNTASASFTVTSDETTEGTETFTLSLDNGKDDISITITDTSTTPLPITYDLSTSDTSVNEGDDFTITLATTNADIGTVIPYVITGVSSADINNASLTGQFILDAEGNGTQTFTASSDLTTEGEETFTLSVDNGNETVNVTINDTSIPTFTLSANKNYVTEGESIRFTISATGDLSGDSIDYNITGISSGDVTSGALSDTVSFTGSGTSYSATVDLTFAEDTTFENNETLTFTANSTTTNGVNVGTLSSAIVLTDSSSTISTSHMRFNSTLGHDMVPSAICYDSAGNKFIVGVMTISSATWGYIIKLSATNGFERFHRYRVGNNDTFFRDCTYDSSADCLYVVGYNNDGQNNAVALRFDNDLNEHTSRFVAGESGNYGSVTGSRFESCDLDSSGNLFAAGDMTDATNSGGLTAKFSWGTSVSTLKLQGSQSSTIRDILITPAGAVIYGYSSIIYPQIATVNTGNTSVAGQYMFQYASRGRFPYQKTRIVKNKDGATNYLYFVTNQPSGTYQGHNIHTATNTSGTTFSSTMATLRHQTGTSDYLYGFAEVYSGGDEIFCTRVGGDEIFITKDNVWQAQFSAGTGYNNLTPMDFRLDNNEDWWVLSQQTATDGRIDTGVVFSLNSYEPGSNIGDMNLQSPSPSYTRGSNGQRFRPNTSYSWSATATTFGTIANGYTTTPTYTSATYDDDVEHVSLTRDDTIWVGTATYELSRSAASINEGQSVTITLTTTEVADGTQVPYTVTGITSADLSGSSTIQGNFTISSGSASLEFALADDATTEGTETLTLSLDNGADSIAVQINDTSTGPETYYMANEQPGSGNGAGFLAEVDIGSNSTYEGWVYHTHIAEDIDDTTNYIYADDQDGVNIWRIEIDRYLYKMTQDADNLYFCYHGAATNYTANIGYNGGISFMKVAKSNGSIVIRKSLRSNKNFGTFQDPDYGYVHILDIAYNSNTDSIGMAFLATPFYSDLTHPDGQTGTWAYPYICMTTLATDTLGNSVIYPKRLAWGSYGGSSIYSFTDYPTAKLHPRGSSGYTLVHMAGYYVNGSDVQHRIAFVNYNTSGAYQSNRVLGGSTQATDGVTYSEPYISARWSMLLMDSTYIASTGTIVAAGIFEENVTTSGEAETPWLVEYWPSGNSITEFKRARGQISSGTQADYDKKISQYNISGKRVGLKLFYHPDTGQLWTAWSERNNDSGMGNYADPQMTNSYFNIRFLAWTGTYNTTGYYHSWTLSRQHIISVEYKDVSTLENGTWVTRDSQYQQQNFVETFVGGSSPSGDPFIRLGYSCHNTSPYVRIHQVAKLPAGGFGINGANTVEYYSDNNNYIEFDSGFNKITDTDTDAGPTNCLVKYRSLITQDPYYMNGSSIDVDDIWVSITDTAVTSSSNSSSNYGNVQSYAFRTETTDAPTITIRSGENLGELSWHNINNIDTIYRLGNFVPYGS